MSQTAGRFVWRELVTPNPTSAATFYTELFGWSVKEQQMGPGATYLSFHHDGLDEDTGGAVAPSMEGVPSHWNDYITVDSLEASLKVATEAGGEALTEAIEIPNIGRFAIIKDPAGATFALFQSADPGSTPTDRRPPVHTFCWSQLMTKNLDAAVPFYNKVFGWEPAPMSEGMVVFKRGEQMIASAMQMPAEAPAPSHWLQYVAVEDTDASWAKAKELGATGYNEPTTIPGMGRFAVLADPSGATFALWKDLSEG